MTTHTAYATSRNIKSVELTPQSREILNAEDISDIQKVITKCPPTNYASGQKRYIITGGPGAGKTSVIKALAELGYTCIPEAATDIIEACIKAGKQKPWRDDDYHIKMYQLIMERQLTAQELHESIMFFDRGHLDGVTYILLQKRKLYSYIVDVVQASIDADFFEKKVFFIDSLGFITPDFARDESLEEATQKAEHLERNYRALGYDIVRIPVGTVEQRVQMITSHVKRWHD